MNGTTLCHGCGGTYARRADGEPRKHRCDGAPVGDVALPWPRPLVTPNDRLHFHRKAALMAQMKTDARWAIRAAKVEPRVAAEVGIHWRVPDRRRRDSDSLQLALKACLDALVAEGVLPDDSWVEVPRAHMTIHPPLKGIPGGMWIELKPVQEDADA